MTRTEQKLAAALYEKPGNYLTFPEVAKATGGKIRGEDTIKVWISHIRKHFGLNCRELFCIRTDGYGLSPVGYDIIKEALGEHTP